MGKTSRRQELLNKESLNILLFSLDSLRKAALHPYCISKFQTCLKPVAAAALGIYFLGLILMIPLLALGSLVSILSLGYIQKSDITETANKALTSAVSLVPFVALIVLRSFIRKPLFKSFIHILREINPHVATGIESNVVSIEAQSSKARNKKAGRYMNKIIFLLALEVVLHFARRSPFLGRPAVALTHFYTMKKALGRDRSIILSLFGFVPGLEPWLLKFVHLWRTSHVLGQQLITDYVTKYVPQSERQRFYKNHDVDIALFALPGSILLQIPIVGPLAFVPIQASAAFLVDKLVREESLLGGTTAVSTPAVAAPTLPPGFPPHETLIHTAPTLPAGPSPQSPSVSTGFSNFR